MKTMTMTEARRRLGAIVAAARAGQIVRITRRGQAVYVSAFPRQSVDRTRPSGAKQRRALARLRALWRASSRRKGETVSSALRAVRTSGYRG